MHCSIELPRGHVNRFAVISSWPCRARVTGPLCHRPWHIVVDPLHTTWAMCWSPKWCSLFSCWCSPPCTAAYFGRRLEQLGAAAGRTRQWRLAVTPCKAVGAPIGDKLCSISPSSAGRLASQPCPEQRPLAGGESSLPCPRITAGDAEAPLALSLRLAGVDSSPCKPYMAPGLIGVIRTPPTTTRQCCRTPIPMEPGIHMLRLWIVPSHDRLL